MNRQRAINDYLDGRLPPERRRAFEARVAAEPELAAELAEARRLQNLLAALPPAPLPGDLTDAVMARVRHELIPRRRFGLGPGAPRRLALAAAAVLAVAGVGLVNRDSNPGAALPAGEWEFVRQCLLDYHHAATAQLVEARPADETHLATTINF